MFNSSVFDLLSRIRNQEPSSDEEPVKEAFTPSPGMEQQVLSGGGGAPPGGGGMDPSMMAQMAGGGGGGGPAAAMAAMQGGGGAPPGMDPAAAGGGAPPGAPGDVPDPLAAKLDQLITLVQQQQQGAGGGAPGQPGKPNTASIKFEPSHLQQMAHDIASVKAVVSRVAEGMGLTMPASTLLNMPTPGQQLPGVGGQPGQAGADPAQQAGGQPAPSPIAQQLPQMPPVAGKAAAEEPRDAHADALRIADMLKAGRAVPTIESNPPKAPSRGASMAAFAGLFKRSNKANQ